MNARKMICPPIASESAPLRLAQREKRMEVAHPVILNSDSIMVALPAGSRCGMKQARGPSVIDNSQMALGITHSVSRRHRGLLIGIFSLFDNFSSLFIIFFGSHAMFFSLPERLVGIFDLQKRHPSLP